MQRSLSGGISAHEEDDIRTAIAKLIIGKPIFSEEWMGDTEG